MTLGSLRTVLRYCQSFCRSRPAEESDGRLLDRYATHRDPVAFEQLLGRHGAMVLGVCRRVLRDEHQAEDAFQATFLVLVRRAAALDGRDSVAGWLYTVAYHIALKLKASSGRSVALEEAAAAAGTPDPADEAARRELRPILDEELSVLPEKYRAPLILCYLQGKTNEEAARSLGWPVGTVSGRLARARDLLRQRLTRRGVALGAAPVALATVPPALARTTAAVAANPPAGTPLAALVDGATRQMARARIQKTAAAALLVCAVLGAAAWIVLRWHEEPQPRLTPSDEALPAVVVQATFPGADAGVVAESVAEPIEAALGGIDGMKGMTSVCDHNGRYALTVVFGEGTDLDRAVTLVQDRVARARATLPEEVRRLGVTVRKKSGDVLLFVILQSDGKHDTRELSNYATLFVKNRLADVPGVGEVLLLGEGDYSMRVWLDPNRLIARDLTATDVVRVLREQNAPPAAGAPGKPPIPDRGFTIRPPGRFVDAAQLGEVVLKVDRDGPMTRLKDVAEVGQDRSIAGVRYNGKPAVVLSVAPAAGADAAEVGPAVRARLAELAANTPPGIHLQAILDASRNEKALRVDVTLPEAASHERTLTVLEECEQLLTGMEGVGRVLVLSGPSPFHLSNHGRLLIGLTPAGAARRDQVAAAVRTRLTGEIPGVLFQLGDPARPRRLSSDGYAVVLAVHGGEDAPARLAAAEELAARLSASGKFTDVGVGPGVREAPSLQIEIDRDQARRLDIAQSDVQDALQVHLGSLYVNDFNAFGRTGQVTVMSEVMPRVSAEDIRRLPVRNSRGEQVRLGEVVQTRETSQPATRQRFNGRPMVVVTANLAPGVSAAEGRRLCETAAREVLPADLHVDWLTWCAHADQ